MQQTSSWTTDIQPSGQPQKTQASQNICSLHVIYIVYMLYIVYSVHVHFHLQWNDIVHVHCRWKWIRNIHVYYTCNITCTCTCLHMYKCIYNMITNIQVLVYMKIVIMIHVHVATVHQRFLITRTIGPKSFLFGTTEFSLWARWHSWVWLYCH